MSTKIYTGFRMSCSWQKAHETIMGFRKELQELYHQSVFKRFAQDIALWIDRKTLGLENKGESPYWYAHKQLQENHKERPDFFDLVLFPFRHGIYGMSFTSQNSMDWTDLWFSKNTVEEYRYWNNTDRPEGMSQALWDQRAKTWDLIIGEFHSIPAMNGFTAQCLEKLPPFVEKESIVSHVPDLDSRVRRVSSEILYKQWYEETKEKNAFSYFNWLSANKERLSQEIARVTPLLAPDLTSEMNNPL